MTELYLSERDVLIFSIDDTRTLTNFIKSAKFKISLRRYVERTDENTIYFKDSLTIHDMKKVRKQLYSIFPHLTVDEGLKEYIENRNYYIENR